MAAVNYSAGSNVDHTLTSNATIRTWVSPSTMDSADTVTVPTITGKSVIVLSAFDTTTGDAVTATVSGFVVTLDAAGGGTNAAYALTYMYV